MQTIDNVMFNSPEPWLKNEHTFNYKAVYKKATSKQHIRMTDVLGVAIWETDTCALFL